MATKRSSPRLVIDCWKTLADPSKLVVTVAGRRESATCFTCAGWAPGGTPGVGQKDTDTDGSCPECAIDWGPTVSLNETTDSSGTSAPAGVLNAIFSSESCCILYFGSSSSRTRYWDLGP